LKVLVLRECGESFEDELVPICASCKKTRDDNNKWNPVERLLSKKKVTCSHGICPECAKELYPELYDEDDNQDN